MKLGINKNAKSILGKLLAQENLDINYSMVETASFNVETRTLTLPLFATENNNIIDLMIGHEVSHALYTENNFVELLKEHDVPASLFNVTEDLRIENLILKKYPGLIGNFIRGYEKLFNDNFFGVNNIDDVNSLDFANKLNILGKIRKLNAGDFSDKEKILVNNAINAKTMLDAVLAAKDIKLYLEEEDEEQEQQENNAVDGDNKEQQQEQENQEDITNDDGQEQAVETGDSDDGRQENDQEQEQQENDQEQEHAVEAGDDDNKSEFKKPSKDNNYNVESQEKFDDNVKSELTEASQTKKSKYSTSVIFPSADLIEKLTLDCKSVAKLVKDFNTNPSNIMAHYNRKQIDKPAVEFFTNMINTVQNGIKADRDNMVKNLIKQFNMKKSAANLKRAKTSKSGNIDVNRLYQYKTSDDIFLSNVEIHDDVDHGIVVMVDLSGSMHSTIYTVYVQILALVDFCTKAQIKYRIIGFSNSPGLVQHRNMEKGEIDIVKEMGQQNHIYEPSLVFLEYFNSEKQSIAERNLIKKYLEYRVIHHYVATITTNTYHKFHIGNFINALNASRVRIQGEVSGNTPLFSGIAAADYFMSQMADRTTKPFLIVMSDGMNSQKMVYNNLKCKNQHYYYDPDMTVVESCVDINFPIGKTDTSSEDNVTIIDYNKQKINCEYQYDYEQILKEYNDALKSTNPSQSSEAIHKFNVISKLNTEIIQLNYINYLKKKYGKKSVIAFYVPYQSSAAHQYQTMMYYVKFSHYNDTKNSAAIKTNILDKEKQNIKEYKEQGIIKFDTPVMGYSEFYLYSSQASLERFVCDYFKTSKFKIGGVNNIDEKHVKKYEKSKKGSLAKKTVKGIANEFKKGVSQKSINGLMAKALMDTIA